VKVDYEGINVEYSEGEFDRLEKIIRGKRGKRGMDAHMKPFMERIVQMRFGGPMWMKLRIASIAEERGIPKSRVVREAMVAYLEKVTTKCELKSDR